MLSTNYHLWFTINGEKYVIDFTEVELNVDFNFEETPLMRSRVKVVVNKMSPMSTKDKIYRSFEDMKICTSFDEVMDYIDEWQSKADKPQRPNG